MKRLMWLLPVLLFLVVIAGFVWRIANPADSVIKSQLVGSKVPAFDLPPAVEGKPGLASADLAGGRPTLLNIFASWCIPCRVEAPVLDELHRRGVTINAIAIRDRGEDVAQFLAVNGDPFGRIGADQASRVQLELGSSGVPETFVIDGRGIITHQHVGPIAQSDLPSILAELEKAR